MLLRIGHEPLLNPHDRQSAFSDYSTTVIKGHHQQNTTQPPSLSSILTIRPEHSSPDPNQTNPGQVLPGTAHTPTSSMIPAAVAERGEVENLLNEDPLGNASSLLSIASMDTYHTARSSSIISSALATEGGSTIRSHYGNFVPLVHRFTLIKPGAKPKKSGSVSPSGSSSDVSASGWNPLDLFWSSGLLVAKCDICVKRLGWKPVLECDDCGLRFVFDIFCLSFSLLYCFYACRTHVKCGEMAPRDCGIRPPRPGLLQQTSMSPLSKVRQSAAAAVAATPNSKSNAKSANTSPTRR